MPTFIQGKPVFDGLFKRLKADRKFQEFVMLLQQQKEGTLLPDSQARLRKLKAEYEPVSIAEIAMRANVAVDPLALRKIGKVVDRLFLDEEDEIRAEARRKLLTELAMHAKTPEDLARLRKAVEEGEI